ncbi:unnamed protein product [Moneuplotes crassus]|uniref:Uncharacterized protein n=1 Tax=Euplotes crassus TaxID=5936 RepID=A0AAD1Y964_EUPCR|nr:unnamed protein product [Moneuplotes crassus]
MNKTVKVALKKRNYRNVISESLNAKSMSDNRECHLKECNSPGIPKPHNQTLSIVVPKPPKRDPKSSLTMIKSPLKNSLHRHSNSLHSLERTIKRQRKAFEKKLHKNSTKSISVIKNSESMNKVVKILNSKKTGTKGFEKSKIMIKRMIKKRLCNDNLQIHDLYNYNSLIDNKLTRRDDFRQIVSTTKELLKITKPELNNFSAERSIHKYLEASKEVSGIYKSSLEEVHKKINLECKDRANDFNFLFKGYSHQVEQERKILQNHIKGKLIEVIYRICKEHF